MIKIAPGTYLEPAGMVLKNYVDIEGSGQTNTIITAGSSAVSNTTVRGVAGALNGEIRNLTITNTGGGGSAVGLWLTGITPAGGFRVSSVTVTASGRTRAMSEQGSSLPRRPSPTSPPPLPLRVGPVRTPIGTPAHHRQP